MNPPRAAFVDFPLGHTSGKPHDPESQRAIVAGALDALETLDRPGRIVTLPVRWSDDDSWKDTALLDGDKRLPRSAEPQWQSDADRLLAERRR